MKAELKARIENILETITEYAKLNFKKKAVLSNNLDEMDALAVGVNMLGEELEKSTVSLHEKEILVKEIHHRVKNNLQVISSMLNLQISFINDPKAKEQFQQSIVRIRNMAMIHENLYQTGNLSQIKVAEYIGSLVQYLKTGFIGESVPIQIFFSTNDDQIELDIEHAVPCGLLINELVTNSIKHAFDRSKGGNIWIEFNKNNDTYDIVVKDDGKGTTMEQMQSGTESLGMHLVEAFVQQLDAKIEFKTKQGTEVKIWF